MEDIKDRCPFMSTVKSGDETQDYCILSEKICLLVGGNKCDIYEEGE